MPKEFQLMNYAYSARLSERQGSGINSQADFPVPTLAFPPYKKVVK